MQDDLERLPKTEEHEVLARFDELWARMAERNADYGEEEVAEDIASARAEISGT